MIWIISSTIDFIQLYIQICEVWRSFLIGRDKTEFWAELIDGFLIISS